jgi:probable F420-dependent oxidoreductase
LSVPLRSFAAQDPGSWADLLVRAEAAEAAGVDRLVVSDHVAFGERLDAYGDPSVGGVAGGAQPTGPDGHWLEPLTVLTSVAARTSTIRLATGILLAGLRRPVVLAKTAATLDVLSDGRLDLGVGVGWQREEYEAAGLDFAERGRILDDTLAVCRTLWSNQRADHRSPLLSFEGIHQMPKPRQAGGVPIWVSGTVNRAVVRRLVAHGAGWIPWGPDAADLPAGIARMRAAVEGAGGDPLGFGVVGSVPVVRTAGGEVDVDRTLERVPELVVAGVTDVRISLPVPGGREAAIDALASVVERFRGLVGRRPR